MCRSNIGTVIKLHSSLLFWLFKWETGHTSRATSWPFMFNCHPRVSSRPKVSDRHRRSASSLEGVKRGKSVRRKKPTEDEESAKKAKDIPCEHSTWPTALLYLLWCRSTRGLRWGGRKHVFCLLCWPLAPGLLSLRLGRHKSLLVGFGRGSWASNGNLEWTLPVPFPWEKLSHECVADLAYIQNMQGKVWNDNQNCRVASNLMHQRPIYPLKALQIQLIQAMNECKEPHN